MLGLLVMGVLHGLASWLLLVLVLGAGGGQGSRTKSTDPLRVLVFRACQAFASHVVQATGGGMRTFCKAVKVVSNSSAAALVKLSGSKLT